MKKSMCITYEVDGSLYVNMTNRCSNRCSFCIRNNGDGAYGSDSLWLEREPTLDETVASVLSHDLTAYRELVFCGYGEPTYRLNDAREVALAAKRACPSVKVRINTNGQSDLILGGDTAPPFEGAFDTVSISLNNSTAERYNEVCHPLYPENAFPSIISFAKRVKRYVPCTVFSVVGEYLTADELLGCRAIADECGIPLRIRDYIGPDN